MWSVALDVLTAIPVLGTVLVLINWRRQRVLVAQEEVSPRVPDHQHEWHDVTLPDGTLVNRICAYPGCEKQRTDLKRAYATGHLGASDQGPARHSSRIVHTPQWRRDASGPVRSKRRRTNDDGLLVVWEGDVNRFLARLAAKDRHPADHIVPPSVTPTVPGTEDPHVERCPDCHRPSANVEAHMASHHSEIF